MLFIFCIIIVNVIKLTPKIQQTKKGDNNKVVDFDVSCNTKTKVTESELYNFKNL